MEHQRDVGTLRGEADNVAGRRRTEHNPRQHIDRHIQIRLAAAIVVDPALPILQLIGVAVVLK